jgi:hypothetical protein
MSAATHSAIINPANPERVQLFRVAEKTHTLGFEQRPLSGKGTFNIWESNREPEKLPSPVLLAPSAMVTMAFDDLVSSLWGRSMFFLRYFYGNGIESSWLLTFTRT